jgi:hypothetical protein
MIRRMHHRYLAALLGLFSCAIPAWSQTAPETAIVRRKQSCNAGGPIYCSPTDLNPAPLTTVPNVGHLLGSGIVVTDPTFANPIARVTDWDTEGTAGRNDNFAVDCGGSAEINFMSADDTKFYTCDAGTGMDLFTFDTATLKASRMYVAHFPNTHGARITTNSSSGEWSFTQADILYDMETGNYQAGTPIIKYYDLSSLTKPPRPQTLYDFSQSPNCVPSSAGNTHWITDVTVSKDDQTFSTSFSLTGGQGTGVWVVVWNRTQGCRWLNTQTGQVGGDWGPAGTINLTDRFSIHNARLSKDGNWVKIGFQSCISTCAAGIQNYLWQIATNNLTACAIVNNCLGHTALGYTHMVNSPTTPTQQSQLIRPLSNINNQTQVWTNGPPSHIPWDNHQSWENVNAADNYPYLSSSDTGVPIVYAWDNEVDGFATDGSGVVFRFAHTFSSGQSTFFSSASAIGSVSADGKYFAWSSDWYGTLGSTTGDKTCTLDSNCRSDVFIVALQ